MSKRIREWPQFIDRNAMYKMADAFEALQRIPAPRFIESVDTAIRLGVDPRKSDQVVRGSVVLPNSHGKTVRVAVFADGDAAMQAKQAGADVVGMEDLVETIKGGDLQFNVVIATPAAMPTVGRLGQILGPRGLMPNPKVGTVTQDVATAVKNAKSGQVRYRTDKNGIIHCTIGRADFSVSALCENLQALIAALQKAKPVNAKGVYLKKIAVSTTMGPGLTVDVASVSA